MLSKEIQLGKHTSHSVVFSCRGAVNDAQKTHKNINIMLTVSYLPHQPPPSHLKGERRGRRERKRREKKKKKKNPDLERTQLLHCSRSFLVELIGCFRLSFISILCCALSHVSYSLLRWPTTCTDGNHWSRERKWYAAALHELNAFDCIGLFSI